MLKTNLIEQVGGIEKAQKIVDRAPDGAEYFSPLSLMWGYHKDVRDNTDASEIADGYTKAYDYFRDGGWWACACWPEHLDDLVRLDELRAAIGGGLCIDVKGEHEEELMNAGFDEEFVL